MSTGGGKEGGYTRETRECGGKSRKKEDYFGSRVRNAHGGQG